MAQHVSIPTKRIGDQFKAQQCNSITSAINANATILQNLNSNLIRNFSSVPGYSVTDALNELYSSGSGSVTSVAMSVPSFLSVSGSPITTSGTLAVSLVSQTANKVFASPNGSSGAPIFRQIVIGDISATGTPSISTFLRGDGSWATISGTGSVTSVALSLPSFITVSGSPVTTSGTLTGTLATQSANRIFAGPSSGGDAAPTFRALVASDIPSLSYVTSVTLSTGTTGLTGGSTITSSGTWTLAGTLNIANGGTGATVANDALNNLLPSQTGNNGKYLTTDGTNTSWATVAGSQSLSSVLSTGNTTGSNDIIISSGQKITSATNTNLVLQANGSGKVAIGDATLLFPDADGSSGQVLSTNGSGTLSWTTVSGTGTVTSVDVSGGTTGLTTSGGPVTTSGTITLSGTLNIANGGTGQTTANDAFNALVPSQTSNSGKFLTTDGTNTSWATVSSGAHSLSATLAVGNTTGSYDIQISSGQKITSATNTNLVLQANGTGKVSLGDANLLFPDSDGTSGQVLVTNGSATLSWTNAVTNTVGMLLNYKADANTVGGMPSAGYIRWDNATQINASNLTVNMTTSDGYDIDAILSSLLINDKIYIQDSSDSANYQNWKVNSSVSGSHISGYWTVPVTLVSSSGTGTSGFSNNHQLFIYVSREGTSSTLSNVLANGNTTGANDIIISSGQKITSATNTNLVLQANGSGKVSIGDANLLFPDSDGTSGYFLTTNGSAVLSWAAIPAPSLTSTYIGFGDGSNLLSGSSDLTFDNSTKKFLVSGGSYLSGDASANSIDMQGGRLRVNAGTATVATGGNAPLRIAQTWNDASLTAYGFVSNYTDTASDANSIVRVVNVNSVPVIQQRKDGAVAFGVNSSSAWKDGVGAMEAMASPSVDPSLSAITNSAIRWWDQTAKRYKYIDDTGTIRTIAATADITTPTLSSVLSAGNTTGANDIIISSGQKITSAANTNLVLQANGSGKVSIGDANLLFPDVDGTSGQVLSTNGSGTLSFSTVGGGLISPVSLGTNTTITSSNYTTYLNAIIYPTASFTLTFDNTINAGFQCTVVAVGGFQVTFATSGGTLNNPFGFASPKTNGNGSSILISVTTTGVVNIDGTLTS